MGKKIIKGTFILTLSGIISKLIGFYYRIFLTDIIGANGMGIYQMVLPVLGLFAALGCAGSELVMSKTIAEVSDNQKELNYRFKIGFLYSMIVSSLSTVLMFLLTPFISKYFVSGDDTSKLLYFMLPALILMAIHSAINGYYIGTNRPMISGLCLCFESITKLLFMFIISNYLGAINKPVLPEHCIIAMVFSELFSSAIMIICKIYDSKKNFVSIEKPPEITGVRKLQKDLYSFFKLAIPVSLTRILLSAIHSVEAILIPVFLVLYGLSEDTAISVYGIIVGMSIPFVLFPSAITTALSSMLLPSISECVAKKDMKSVSKSSSMALRYSMSMGIFFTFFFLSFGKMLGILFFKNSLAGEYLTIFAWLCPFIYVEITLSGIINGFGLTKNTCIYNIISAIIRIIFLLVFIPMYGIIGYLWGLLAGEITGTILTVVKTNKICHLQYSVTKNLIIPIFYSIISIGFSITVKYLIDDINIFPPLLTLIMCCGLSCILFLLFTIHKELPDIHNN